MKTVKKPHKKDLFIARISENLSLRSKQVERENIKEFFFDPASTPSPKFFFFLLDVIIIYYPDE